MSGSAYRGDIRSLRSDIWAALLIGLLTLAWLVFLADGRPEMDPDGARALHVAQNIATGEGQIIKYVDLDKGLTSHPDITKPPLYPAVIALFMLAGLSPKLAGWAVTFIGFAAATSFLYLLSRRVVSRAPALLVAGLFATLMTGVRWGINLHEESLFLVLSFAALWLQMGIVPNEGAQVSWRVFYVGILVGLAMLTSYQGLPLLICLGGFTLWFAWQLRSPRVLLAYVGGLTLVGALPLLNFLDIWASGIRPGFDKGDPTWYIIIAGEVSAWQRAFLGDLYVWLEDGSLSDLIIVGAFYSGLIALLTLSWRNDRLRLLAIYATLYLAMVILQLGGGGKPYFETRYNMPVETVIVLMAVALAGGWLKKVPQSGLRALAVIGMFVLTGYGYAQFNRYQEMMAGRKGEFCPAPESIAWIKQHIPVGSVILGSQCTYQLFAETNAYNWLAIPPARSEETPPPRWSEQDMLNAAQRVGSQWVVLITGEQPEPLLSKPGYGPFVEGLFTGQGSDRVHLEARLKDGLIYRIRPQSN
jgi:hypothetical protein